LTVDDKWVHHSSVLVNPLEPRGFEVVEATDGLDALFNANEFQPDVLFMGLVILVIDSFEVTCRLRMLPDLTNFVIIAISLSVFNFDKQQSREVRRDDFLAKLVQEAEPYRSTC